MSKKTSAQTAAGLLRQELERRVTKNPRYSLRSFAKSLGISHTILSLILSGKRNVSRKVAEKIAEKLTLNPRERLILHADRSDKGTATDKTYDQISLEKFELIADWKHFAILSLTETCDFLWDAKWIARRLGVGEMAAKIAMNRLIELGMIGRVGSRYRQITNPIKVENEISTVATRKFHRELLEKAQESLENDAAELRDFSSMTLALNPSLIPYAKERIRKFRRELTAELEADGSPTEVYNLTVQIYPVSKRRSEQ